MAKRTRAGCLLLVLTLMLAGLFPPAARAEDAIETTGIAIGVTAGNMWFVPIKGISTSMGIMSGALSFVLSGGNQELTKQIWRDTTQGPYLITPELAKKSIGDRPELQEKQ